MELHIKSTLRPQRLPHADIPSETAIFTTTFNIAYAPSNPAVACLADSH